MFSLSPEYYGEIDSISGPPRGQNLGLGFEHRPWARAKSRSAWHWGKSGTPCRPPALRRRRSRRLRFFSLHAAELSN
jgi:hypothetical protein